MLLSPEDVASACGLSRKAVYRAIERGELPATRLCSRLRIRPQDIESWIHANQVVPAARETRRPRSATAPAAGGLRRLIAEP